MQAQLFAQERMNTHTYITKHAHTHTRTYIDRHVHTHTYNLRLSIQHACTTLQQHCTCPHRHSFHQNASELCSSPSRTLGRLASTIPHSACLHMCLWAWCFVSSKEKVTKNIRNDRFCLHFFFKIETSIFIDSDMCRRLMLCAVWTKTK